MDRSRITLRAAIPKDEPFLRLLFEAVRSDLFALLPEQQRDAIVEMQFRAQQAYYRATQPNATYEVILLDQVPIGNLTVSSGEDICLVDINVLPEHQRHGIATLLIRRLLDRAVAAEKPVTLHVDPANPAQNLYVRLGFNPVSNDATSIRMIYEP